MDSTKEKTKKMLIENTTYSILIVFLMNTRYAARLDVAHGEQMC